MNGHLSCDLKLTIGDRLKHNYKKKINYYGENLCFGKRKGYSIVIEMLMNENNRTNILIFMIQTLIATISIAGMDIATLI